MAGIDRLHKSSPSAVFRSHHTTEKCTARVACFLEASQAGDVEPSALAITPLYIVKEPRREQQCVTIQSGERLVLGTLPRAA